jgi:hypothetical protein
LLNELARHVVDCNDMVGVESVPQTESVGEERRSQQGRMAMNDRYGPNPRDNIGFDEKGIDAGSSCPASISRVAEEASDDAFHSVTSNQLANLGWHQ